MGPTTRICMCGTLITLAAVTIATAIFLYRKTPVLIKAVIKPNINTTVRTGRMSLTASSDSGGNLLEQSQNTESTIAFCKTSPGVHRRMFNTTRSNARVIKLVRHASSTKPVRDESRDEERHAVSTQQVSEKSTEIARASEKTEQGGQVVTVDTPQTSSGLKNEQPIGINNENEQQRSKLPIGGVQQSMTISDQLAGVRMGPTIYKSANFNKSVPKFSREKNVLHWLEDFEFYARDLDPRDKVEAILYHLDEELRSLLRHLSDIPDPWVAYTRIRNQLIDSFPRTIDSYKQYERQFHQRTQQNTESLSLFHLSLQKIAKDAFPHMAPGERDERIKEQFLKGIGDQYIRRSLRQHEHEELQTVLRLAIDQERRDRDEPNSQQAIRNMIQEEFRRMQASQYNHPPRPQEQYQLVHHSDPSGRPRDPRPPKTCHNCQQPGHIARECPSPPRPAQTNLIQGAWTGQTITSISGSCKVNGQWTKFLIDTGAELSVISASLLLKCRISELTPTKTVITSAQQSEIPTLGLATVRLELFGERLTCPVMVATQLSTETIIGMDVLTRHRKTRNSIAVLTNLCTKREKTEAKPVETETETSESPKAQETEAKPVETETETSESPKAQETEARPVEPKQNVEEESRSTDTSDQKEASSETDQVFPEEELTPTNSLSPNKPVCLINVSVNSEPIEDISEEECMRLVAEQIKKVTASSLTNLTPTSSVSHRIEVTPGPPIRQKCRVVPFHKENDVKEIIDELHAAGMIRRSKAQWASGIHIVKKPDGTYRMTIDYKALNKRTVKDAYPLPNIPHLLTSLRHAKVFTKLDLLSGYYQIPMEESSKEYTAFICKWGLFEFNVMPMGLTNACATFQRMMDSIFADVNGKFENHYIDDVFIYSRNYREHVEHVTEICRRLKENDLWVKEKKVEMVRSSISFLGHYISDGTIKPNSDKMEKLLQTRVPSNKKEVESFLGLAQYYNRFTPGLAEMTHPLYELTGKAPFVWEARHASDGRIEALHRLYPEVYPSRVAVREEYKQWVNRGEGPESSKKHTVIRPTSPVDEPPTEKAGSSKVETAVKASSSKAEATVKEKSSSKATSPPAVSWKKGTPPPYKASEVELSSNKAMTSSQVASQIAKRISEAQNRELGTTVSGSKGNATWEKLEALAKACKAASELARAEETPVKGANLSQVSSQESVKSITALEALRARGPAQTASYIELSSTVEQAEASQNQSKETSPSLTVSPPFINSKRTPPMSTASYIPSFDEIVVPRTGSARAISGSMDTPLKKAETSSTVSQRIMSISEAENFVERSTAMFKEKMLKHIQSMNFIVPDDKLVPALLAAATISEREPEDSEPSPVTEKENQTPFSDSEDGQRERSTLKRVLSNYSIGASRSETVLSSSQQERQREKKPKRE